MKIYIQHYFMFISTLDGAIGGIYSRVVCEINKGNALVSQLMLLMIYVAVSKIKTGNMKMSSLDTIGLTISLYLIFVILIRIM